MSSRCGRLAQCHQEERKSEPGNQRTDRCSSPDLGRRVIAEPHSRPSNRQDERGYQQHPRAEQDHEDSGNPRSNSHVDRYLPEGGDRESDGEADEARADERNQFRR